jgi:protein gp37
MADKSKIEWTDATWNPVFGCDKVSPGCANCYAESYAKRFRATVPFTTITLHEDRLGQPVRWAKPRRIFVGSLSDVFHANIPVAYRDLIFVQMVLAGHHTFQVLTKRPDLALAYLDGLTRRESLFGAALNCLERRGGPAAHSLVPESPRKTALDRFWPLANVWIGTSVESQVWADRRVPDLLKIPATVRFLSVEPMLGPIDGRTIQKGIGWVIVGGESGPNARPMNADWARRLRAVCSLEGVPFFMKQLGGWPNKRDGLDYFPQDLRVREWPDPMKGKP